MNMETMMVKILVIYLVTVMYMTLNVVNRDV